MINKPQRKLLLLSSLGGVLEFYDFIIYALLAADIAKEFFPTGNNITSLLATFVTFTIGYLARPLGGIIFGHFGDRFGRKKTFAFSIFLMATATLCIGLVPNYSTIGIAAPIILTFLRVLQGLSVGGEIPGAIAYVSESIPQHKGVTCSIIFFALINGIVLGSLVQALLNSFLTTQEMVSWGWRLPFIFGGIFGFISYRLRLNIEESKLFQNIKDKVEKLPIASVLHKNLKNSLLAIFIVGFGAATTTLLFLFIPSYLNNVLHKKIQGFVWINTFAIFLSSLICIFSGMLADKFNPKILLATVAVIAIVLIYPIFIIYTKYFSLFFISLLLSACIHGLAWGIIPSLLAELSSTSIRYSSIAFSYNLGFAIFGGLTPLIAMILIYHTGSSIAPIFYFIPTAIFALLATTFVKKVDIYTLS